jgi:hypothetical protein
MDLSPYLGWIIFIHVTGAFVFVLSHGVSVFASFAIRGTRDPARIAALLDLSATSLGGLYLGLLVLLVAGITAGLIEGWRGWMWAAIVVLVVVVVAMYAVATRYYAQVRAAVGAASSRETEGQPPTPPASPEQLDALLSTRRPEMLAVIGFAGLLILLYLMFFKPF